MAYSTDDIRNIVLLGQAASGKTILSESILHVAGMVTAKGEVERKNTVSDQDVLEKNHQRSLVSSVLSFDFKSTHVNLIDTPGYSDFMGPALSAMDAAETAVIVVNAQNGIETMTRRFIELARNNNKSTAIVINKIDAEGVDLEGVYASIQQEIGSECLAVNLPANGGKSVVGCLFSSDGEADFSSVEEANTAITDQIVEVDEQLLEDYLETGELSQDKIVPSFKQAMREGHLIPVSFVSANTDAGVAEQLELFKRLLPSPSEGNETQLVQKADDGDKQLPMQCSESNPFAAHVFKIAFDPFVGKIGVFKVLQGKLSKDDSIYIGDARKAIRVSNLFSLLGKQHNDVTSMIAGDIGAVAKIDDVEQDSILLDTGSDWPIHLKRHPRPNPMVGLAILPATRGDEQKVAEALQKISAEDPCLTLERNPSTNETILRALGDLHLRVALERLNEVYSVEVNTSVPTVPYKETVTKIAEGHCRHKKQTGGAGQFGEVFLKVEPLTRGQGFEFVDNVVGGVIPSQFIPAVEKGVRQVLEGGAFAGFEIQDIRVVVYDGKHHSVDSKEIAFITAGKKAFIDAISKAGPIILEPIVDVVVTVPNSYMGDIAGELSSRRGRISDTDSMTSGFVRITGSAPLAEMSDFQAKLNAISGGEGSFIMEFASYESAPVDVQKKLSAAFNQPDED